MTVMFSSESPHTYMYCIYIPRDCMSVLTEKLPSLKDHRNRTQSSLWETVAKSFPGMTGGDLSRGRVRRCSYRTFTFKPLSTLLHLSCDVTEGFADPFPTGRHGILNPGSLGDARICLYLRALLHGVQILSGDKREERSSHMLCF